MDRLRLLTLLCMLSMLIAAGGCQSGHVVSNHQLMEHQASVDFAGLQSTQSLDSLKVVAAPPRGWNDPIIQKNAIYTHEQWRSPTLKTGVGVVYLHLPIPLSSSMVVWFAERQYGERAKDGKMVSEWTDGLGRDWFEAESKKYHVRGYVITQGFEAWVVYYGYKLGFPVNFNELAIASRSAESMVPDLNSSDDDTPASSNEPKMAAIGK